MTEEDNFKDLCNLTTSLLGLRKGSLAHKSQRMELQVPRSAVAVIARIEESTHYKTIAKVLKRDRSLIYHYVKVHEGHYASFPKYRNVFNKIYTAYTELQNCKKEFLDERHLENYLKENDIFSSVKHQTNITIKCGVLKTNVKVSYREFYHILENIKLALQDYKYTIEIT